MHVFTRGEHNRRLAAELGADSVGGAADPSPEPLDGAILFAPAGRPRAGRAAGAGPRGHAGGRRHLAVDDPWSGLRRASCSRSAGCAASRPTPGRTARSSCGWPAGSASGRPRSPTRWRRRRRPWPISRTAASAARPSCTTDAVRRCAAAGSRARSALCSASAASTAGTARGATAAPAATAALPRRSATGGTNSSATRTSSSVSDRPAQEAVAAPAATPGRPAGAAAGERSGELAEHDGGEGGAGGGRQVPLETAPP